MPPWTNDSSVVAALRYPMRIEGLKKIVDGLQQMHGKGLVIRTDLGDGEWMVLAHPTEPPSGVGASPRPTPDGP